MPGRVLGRARLHRCRVRTRARQACPPSETPSHLQPHQLACRSCVQPPSRIGFVAQVTKQSLDTLSERPMRVLCVVRVCVCVCVCVCACVCACVRACVCQRVPDVRGGLHCSGLICLVHCLDVTIANKSSAACVITRLFVCTSQVLQQRDTSVADVSAAGFCYRLERRPRCRSEPSRSLPRGTCTWPPVFIAHETARRGRLYF